MNTRSQPSGKIHLLLYYQHTMMRLWRVALAAEIALGLSWWILRNRVSSWLLDFIWFGILVVLVLAVFFRLARNMGYVQAKRDHLLLSTPFLRLKISYRRIISARPMDFVQIFSPQKMNWADSRFAKPYFKKTILAVILNGYPISPAILRLFLPKFIFHPLEHAGFVLAVPDWLALSTEIDSFQGSWRETQGQRLKNIGMRGMYKDDG